MTKITENRSHLITVDRISDNFGRKRFLVTFLDRPAVLADVEVLDVGDVSVYALQALLKLLLVAGDHVHLEIDKVNVLYR